MRQQAYGSSYEVGECQRVAAKALPAGVISLPGKKVQRIERYRSVVVGSTAPQYVYWDTASHQM